MIEMCVRLREPTGPETHREFHFLGAGIKVTHSIAGGQESTDREIELETVSLCRLSPLTPSLWLDPLVWWASLVLALLKGA